MCIHELSARIGGASLIVGIKNIAQRVSELAIQQSNDEELLLSEAPENFLDPIMSTLMTDPVILPSSKMNVDRSTIARYLFCVLKMVPILCIKNVIKFFISFFYLYCFFRHLLSDQTDPFNRSHLTMDMVTTNTELKIQIDEWIKLKRAQK